MIESIEIWGIRGIENRKVEFGQHTLIVGPNGTGKTALMCGLHFVCIGHVAGAKPSEMFLNASNQEQIRARAKINGRLIERRLTNGKTLSESISIDGVSQKIAKGAADAVMVAAFGRDPLIVDIPELQRASSTVRRRMILGMTCDLERLDKATQDEETARTTANDARAHRQQCEKAMATLSQQLAGMERPAGSTPVLKGEKEALSADLKAARQRVADGDANDRARQGVETAEKALPGLREVLGAAETAASTSKSDLEAIQARLDGLEKPSRPAGRSKPLDEDVIAALTTVVERIDSLDAVITPEDGAKPYVAEIRMLVAALLPNKRAQAKYQKELDTYTAAQKDLCQKISALKDGIDVMEAGNNNLKQKIAGHEQVLATAAAVGPSATDQDKALVAGLEAKIAEIEAKLESLSGLNAIEKSIEQAKISVERASKAEEDARAALTVAQKAMADLINEAAVTMSTRSAEVLNHGNMVMRDDGKDLDILWARPGSGDVFDRLTPWVTLSGGEKAVFDCAVGHCLAPSAMVVIEGAEVDDQNMVALIRKLNGSKLQVCVLTCHEPAGLDLAVHGSDWKVIRT